MEEEKKLKWDARFFALCKVIGSWSEDKSRQVGCVIVGPDLEIRATGYNGLARGVKNLAERHIRDNGHKYLWFEHAERNAIFNAARVGTPLAGCRIYITNFPCADCARAIIQAGIIEVITAPQPNGDSYFKNHYKAAAEMFADAKVNVVTLQSV